MYSLPSRASTVLCVYFNAGRDIACNNLLLLECKKINIFSFAFVVLLDLQKYDGGFGTIQHPKNKRYIAMNSNGTLYSTTTFSEEVLFKYLTGHYPYIQFSSHKYKNNGKDMLIGLRADGTIKKGKKTSLTHKSTKFLIVGTI